MLMKPDRNFLPRLFRWTSIRMWFTIPFLLQLFITIGLIGFFLVQDNINSSKLVLKELQGQMLKQVKDQLSERLQEAMHLNQTNAASLQAGILELEFPLKRERYFVNHIKAFPNVAMTFIALADGSVYGASRTADDQIHVVRSDSTTGGDLWYYRTADLGEGTEVVRKIPGFDMRTRPWYSQAVEAGGPVFSNKYHHLVFQEPAITAGYPVYDREQRLIGVFGVVYLISWLGDTLRSLPTGTSGQVFVADSTGLLIAGSPMQEGEGTLISASLALPLNENQDDLPGFTLDGRHYYVGISDFEEYGTHWKIYAILAEDDFLGGMKKATVQTVLILVVLLLLSLLFAFWLAGWVTKPIVSLNKAAKELAKGNRISIPDDGRKDELGELTRSFNEMGIKLTGLLSHLEEEVKLRTQELRERNEELQRLSFSDSLTGIANRRRFDATFNSVWNSALRYQRPIALLMLDIDFFKNYNDTYGHQAGDDCLKSIGSLLKNKVRRSSDLAARYGGEEFAVLLQDMEKYKIAGLAEDIRKSVQELNIEHETSPFQKVTISIGCAYMIPTPEKTPAELIEMADRALYQAKKTGRNRVVSAIAT